MTLTEFFYSKKTGRIYRNLPQNGDAVRLRICSCGFICHANDVSGPNYNKVFEHSDHKSIDDLTSTSWLDLCKNFITSSNKNKSNNEKLCAQNYTDSATQTVEEREISLQNILNLITKNQTENSNIFNNFITKHNHDVQRLSQQIHGLRGKHLLNIYIRYYCIYLFFLSCAERMDQLCSKFDNSIILPDEIDIDFRKHVAKLIFCMF